jgi:hypothetical protein
MTTIHAVIHDRRIEVPAPRDLPDGTKVVLTIDPATSEDELMTCQEIERVLAAMQSLEPLDLPEGTAADLDAWENRLKQHGIDRVEHDNDELFQ